MSQQALMVQGGFHSEIIKALVEISFSGGVTIFLSG